MSGEPIPFLRVEPVGNLCRATQHAKKIRSKYNHLTLRQIATPILNLFWREEPPQPSFHSRNARQRALSRAAFFVVAPLLLLLLTACIFLHVAGSRDPFKVNVYQKNRCRRISGWSRMNIWHTQVAEGPFQDIASCWGPSPKAKIA